MKAVGFYVAPFEIITKAGILPGSLVLTLFPSFSHLQGREEHEKARTLFSYAVKYLIIGIGPASVLLVFFAGPILKLWLGAEFAQASLRVFQVMAAGFLVTSLSDVALAFIQGVGRPDLTAKIHVLELVLFVPLGWIFIKTWGINGAAAAWALRVTFDMAALYALTWKVGNMRFSLKELLERGLPQGLLALALLGLGTWSLQHLLGKTLGIAVSFLVFLVLCGFFALTKKEIAWLREGLPRLWAGAQRKAGV
jgi:O-antigen/teichoic acid export membrane protein